MTAQRKPRRADRYTLLRVGDPNPLTPNIVRRMLDEIPDYTTTMPWEDN